MVGTWDPFLCYWLWLSYVRWFANAKTWHNLTPNIIVQFLASFTLFITFFALALLVRCKTWRDMSQQHWRDALHFVHSKEVWEGGVGELMVFICANFPNIYFFPQPYLPFDFHLKFISWKRMKETLKIIKTISLFVFFSFFPLSLSLPLVSFIWWRYKSHIFHVPWSRSNSHMPCSWGFPPFI